MVKIWINRSQLKPYVISFNEKLANKDETCELFNNERDDQMGKLLNIQHRLPDEIVEQIILPAI